MQPIGVEFRAMVEIWGCVLGVSSACLVAISLGVSKGGVKKGSLSGGHFGLSAIFQFDREYLESKTVRRSVTCQLGFNIIHTYK